MKSFLVAIFLALVATFAIAQTPVDAQSQQGYATPDDALYAALITPGYVVSAVVPVTTPGPYAPFVTWNVIRQAVDTECSEPSHDQPWPTAWVWTAPACGHGLAGPEVMTFSDLPTLRTWALSNLTLDQRKTMVVHHPVGTQRNDLQWWLVFQHYSAFCS